MLGNPLKQLTWPGYHFQNDRGIPASLKRVRDKGKRKLIYQPGTTKYIKSFLKIQSIEKIFLRSEEWRTISLAGTRTVWGCTGAGPPDMRLSRLSAAVLPTSTPG